MSTTALSVAIPLEGPQAETCPNGYWYCYEEKGDDPGSPIIRRKARYERCASNEDSPRETITPSHLSSVACAVNARHGWQTDIALIGQRPRMRTRRQSLIKPRKTCQTNIGTAAHRA
jgi:hypothetical protein